MYDVKGKWALITGAARGIGYLTAKFMAEHPPRCLIKAGSGFFPLPAFSSFLAKAGLRHPRSAPPA